MGRSKTGLDSLGLTAKVSPPEGQGNTGKVDLEQTKCSIGKE